MSVTDGPVPTERLTNFIIITLGTSLLGGNKKEKLKIRDSEFGTYKYKITHKTPILL